MRYRCGVYRLVLGLSLTFTPLAARVIRVEVTSRADIMNAKAFGPTGSYERLAGRVFFSAPSSNPHNARIVDLANAVNLKNGEVEFSSDFTAVAPKAGQGNGSLILEVPNRGHESIVSLVDGGARDGVADAGDAWLLRNGYTIVSLGWQWDVVSADGLRLYAPIAREKGETITGLLRGDIMPPKTLEQIPLGHLNTGNPGGLEYPVANPDDPRNTLTVRDSPDGPRSIIPRTKWQFAQMKDGKLQSSNRHIHVNGGLEAGRIYEYVYVVADPVVAGLGLAAIRDFASYAKHSPQAIVHATRVIGQGISQDGRVLRTFLYEGFNADENGAIALDGVLAHVAGAGRGSFNYRFAQPSRDGQPTSSIFFPTDVFPFTDQPETDPQTGDTGGLLDRAAAEKVVPKLFLTNTSYEYWSRSASLIHRTVNGDRDVAISPDVRIYHLTGLQHFSGPFPPARGQGDLAGQNFESPLPVKYFWRTMIANMDAWLASNTEPPPNSYPKIADNTLVTLANYHFPSIPGVNKPLDASRAYRISFGPNWRDGILTRQPPEVGEPFAVLVPQVDADGNETDGIRLPEITVPLATYTGWNLRDPSIGAPRQRVSFEGSCIWLPRTAQERMKSRDPRQSIAERYTGRDDYLHRYAAKVDQLIEQRWILREDRDALIHRGEQEWSEATK